MNSEKPVIFFIAPTTSQPRFHKRVSEIAKLNPSAVFAFSRGYYEENKFPENVAFYSLGKIKDGHYLERISKMFRAVMTIRSQLRNKTRCVFYAFGFDCLLLAWICGIKRGFYEVGDIRNEKKGGGLLASIERIFEKKVLGLVLTSRFFYEAFYQNQTILSSEKIFIVENKLNCALAGKRPDFPKQIHNKITIGFIGLLRYKRPIEMLIQFVKERSQYFEVECFGDGPYRSVVETNVCDCVRYHGSFKNPDHLATIYREVDVNYSVYEYTSVNVRLAIPNKLFESAFFGVPILSGYSTALSKWADDWGIGKAIRLDSMEHFSDDMATVKKEWIETASQNCFKIAESELLDDSEEVCKRIVDRCIENE